MTALDVLCFGGEDWWYHNRAHIDMQLMRRFATMGKTLYVNSIVMQKPNLGEGRMFLTRVLRKGKSIFSGLRDSDAGFSVYSPFTLPVHHISWAKPFNRKLLAIQISRVQRKLGMKNPLVWVACPAACDVAIQMKRTQLVYQRTDRFEDFPGVDEEAVRAYDLKLKEHADLTIFVNERLFEEERDQCSSAIYLDHGVDYEFFASAEENPDQPPDIADIPRPIVGFYGGFGEHTTDTDLIESVSRILPEMSFVLVGAPSPQCDQLQNRSNVWMLGQKSYEQIPDYGKCFDVAIMPWKQNSWIQACNPIKLKEYLALGKPIVSTPFPELRRYDGLIHQAKTPEEFARAIETALTQDSEQAVAARRKMVAQSTWDQKAQMVLDSLDQSPGTHDKEHTACETHVG